VPYCTSADVLQRLPALQDASDQTGVGEQVEAGIEWAQSVIDPKLANRYAVPFTSVPITIKHIAADLAASFAARLSYSGGGNVTELSKELREDALSRLQALADGTDVLPLPDDQVDETSNNLPALHTNYGRTPTDWRW